MAYGYAALVGVLWCAVRLTDRIDVATLIGFGPRWLAAVPLVPLTAWMIVAVPKRQMALIGGVLALSATALLIGVLDLRLGLGRTPGPPSVRVMTQNLGGSAVDADVLGELMVREQVDVAAFQECPFYDNSPTRPGWQFYYGGDLCLLSRYPFTVLDILDPDNEWRRGGRTPIRFEIRGPVPFQVVNVHFQTVRGGLTALWGGRGEGLGGFEDNRREASQESSSTRARVRALDGPFLVVGDFNLPVESAFYRDNWADLRNMFSRCGRGFGHTKFTPLFGIRIDHVIASGHWECTDARVLSSPYGGDHAPLIVDLNLTS